MAAIPKPTLQARIPLDIHQRRTAVTLPTERDRSTNHTIATARSYNPDSPRIHSRGVHSVGHRI